MAPLDDPELARLEQALFTTVYWHRRFAGDPDWPRDRFDPRWQLLQAVGRAQGSAEGWPVLRRYTPDELNATADRVLTAIALEDA